MTDFSKKVEILGEFYSIYKDDSDLEDFIEFNDLGLPLAYLASEELCDLTDEGMAYVLETWDMFLASLDLEDTGFKLLSEVFEKKAKE